MKGRIIYKDKKRILLYLRDEKKTRKRVTKINKKRKKKLMKNWSLKTARKQKPRIDICEIAKNDT